MKQIKIIVILGIVSSLLLYGKLTQHNPKLNKLYTMNSIKDLVALQHSRDKTMVWIAGKQGGYFEYNSYRKKENDGCTVFNGWERKTQDPMVNILWCGAMGDGKTDDTSAFRKALKAAYVYRKKNRGLYLPSGTYRLTQKIVIPARYHGKKNDFFTLYGDG